MSAAVQLAVPPLLSDDQATLLARLTDGLDGAGLWWLSGYAAGLARAHGQPARAIATATQNGPGARLTVVYGSQTGNARRVAERLAQAAEADGLAVRLLRADAYHARDLAAERHLVIVISTQGEGDPPDDARGLVEFIAGKRAPRLPELRYAVLGLGDSSYPQFCAVGRQLDARLAELGATRLVDRGDADLDIDSVATPWVARALSAAKDALKTAAPLATVTPLRPSSLPAFHRDAPYAAEVLANQGITGRGSTRDIRHLELSLAGSGLAYEPGDAMGVWPRNPPALVAAVLQALRLDGDREVELGGEVLPLHAWLRDRRELTRLSRPVIAAHAERSGDPALRRLLAADGAADLATLLSRHQLIDLLREHPAAWSADALVAALRPLAPRLYSIASSRKEVGDEAHLTVAHLAWERDGETRRGAASHFLAGAGEGTRVPVYVERNERFRVPADGARDVVMIGPGTGVAPFRGFVQERAAEGATGRNWLLFGNPHARSDFLYQLEWQEALRRGTLHRLDVAFSRDQPAKVYVQDRLCEHGRALFDWLEGGAHLYVCGATAMGRDVHAALRDVVALHGGGGTDAADDYLRDLQAQGRYSRDVY